MAQDGFKYFRSKVTGLVGSYPAHFAFLESFEEVDADDAACIDCLLTDEDKVELRDSVETDVYTDFTVVTPNDVATKTHETKDKK